MIQRITKNDRWQAIAHYVPILGWLPHYQRAWLQADLIAGVTLWGVGVPSALAYAQMAGMPPVTGLYTAFVALFLYSILATSRHQKVTTSSTMAVMSASVVAPLAMGDPSLFLAATSMLAIIAGVMLLLAGIAKLGIIADFLSRPVITGFVFGLAINIIIGQSAKILGYSTNGGSSVQQAIYLLTHLEQTHWLTLAMGVGTLILIFWMRYKYPKIPGALVALVVGILIIRILNLDERGVTIVGDIPTGLPSLSVPFVDLDSFVVLVVGAVGIVFLAVGESIGTARSFATRYRYEIDADQELIAMGIANIGTGLTQGFTADASLSTTATADAAGAKSQLSSLVASALIMLTAAFLAGLFRNLPNAVLGAVVIASVVKLVDYKEMARYLRQRPVDFMLATLAAVGVLVASVLAGLLAAVFMSLAIIIYQTSRPQLSQLGRVPDDGSYAILNRNPPAYPVPGVLILSLDGPLYFYNANLVSADVLSAVASRPDKLHAAVLDLRSTPRLDITASDMLGELAERLKDQGIDLYLVVPQRPLMRLLRSESHEFTEATLWTGMHPAVESALATAAAEAATAQGALPAGEPAIDASSPAAGAPSPAVGEPAINDAPPAASPDEERPTA